MSRYEDQFGTPKTYAKVAKSSSSSGHVVASTSSKSSAPPPPEYRKMAAIENETEAFHVEKSGLDLANRIKTLRSQKEMTQKELAHAASVKIDIIRDLENGTGPTPDPKLIRRLEQILGGPLRPQKPAKPKRGK